MTGPKLIALIDEGTPPKVLDVRSRAEFEKGHVPGALHLPFWKVLSQARELPLSIDDQVVVYCGHGPRARLAGSALRHLGFRRVEYLDGHMTRWKRAGLREER